MLPLKRTSSANAALLKAAAMSSRSDTDFGDFVSEKRGETIRYSRLHEDSETGKTAFVDNGKKMEIHEWKDRQACLPP